jgi:septal ring factor EnvC (AmiA/AmiB activator)
MRSQKVKMAHTAGCRISGAIGMMAGLPNERRETLAVHAEATDRRIAALEAELESAREKLAILENQNLSLQTSLDLIADEYSRLSRHLTESDPTVDKARLQIERIKIVLRAAEAERKRLAVEFDASNNRGDDSLQHCVATEEHQTRATEPFCSKSTENRAQILLAGTITF